MSSVYAKKPWLQSYPEWFPASVFPPTQRFLDLFNSSFQDYPDDPYIHYFDTVCSDKEIHQMACSMAAAREKVGVNKGDRIMLVLPKTLTAKFLRRQLRECLTD